MSFGPHYMVDRQEWWEKEGEVPASVPSLPSLSQMIGPEENGEDASEHQRRATHPGARPAATEHSTIIQHPPVVQSVSYSHVELPFDQVHEGYGSMSMEMHMQNPPLMNDPRHGRPASLQHPTSGAIPMGDMSMARNPSYMARVPTSQRTPIQTQQSHLSMASMGPDVSSDLSHAPMPPHPSQQSFYPGYTLHPSMMPGQNMPEFGMTMAPSNASVPSHPMGVMHSQPPPHARHMSVGHSPPQGGAGLVLNHGMMPQQAYHSPSSHVPPAYPLPRQQQGSNRSSFSSTSSNAKTYAFIPLPGMVTAKRPRRKFDEIERHYTCNWPECDKSYGTLNHLNAHVSMQKHGPKRSPNEFKELRKMWRRQKREDARKAAMAASGTPEYQAQPVKPEQQQTTMDDAVQLSYGASEQQPFDANRPTYPLDDNVLDIGQRVLMG